MFAILPWQLSAIIYMQIVKAMYYSDTVHYFVLTILFVSFNDSDELQYHWKVALSISFTCLCTDFYCIFLSCKLLC